ncbi:hypothetical protein AB0B21_05525 [Streptomyces rimosus]|uniref:effector-associated constant component EACC1 n=1 Tax=Streptomyces rimosus TaxID=1927 RepID=UPI0033CF1828
MEDEDSELRSVHSWLWDDPVCAVGQPETCGAASQPGEMGTVAEVLQLATGTAQSSLGPPLPPMRRPTPCRPITQGTAC